MRRVLIVVVLVVAAAVLGLWRTNGGVRQGLRSAVGMSDDKSPGEARDEIHKSFQLQPGDHVEVMGINGPVTIETSDTKIAEVNVIRTAQTSDSLNRREIVLEQTPTGFAVRGRERHTGLWDHLFGRNPKEEVTIKAPREIALSIRGVNGAVTTGDVTGSIEVKGVNGRVQSGSATEFTELAGINGNITVGLKRLGERGARFSGINGNIELRLVSGLNADLSANGMNGSVRSEIPDISVEKAQYAPRYSARIGNGGAQITISGINGNVRLTRAEGSVADSGPSDKKSGGIEKAAKTSSESKVSKEQQ